MLGDLYAGQPWVLALQLCTCSLFLSLSVCLCACVLRNTITSFLGEQFGDLYAAKRGGVEKAEPMAGA